MLEFFRKYQWYFFLVITIVVIISFSFFGTYNTISSNSWREQIAFTAVNGKEIPVSDVDDLANFIATNSDDKRLFGGSWGMNFLNDGVIQKDFLQTGLAQELVKAYPKEISSDLQKRLVKEKRFQPYTHPEAKFLSVENIWTYFAPEMIAYLGSLKVSEDPVDQDAFNARVKLYLAERKIPDPMLRQVLRYQERQYNWLSPDPDLDRTDLSLFGYHTLEDWFGPKFVRLVSQFIINASILAEQKGYDVSKAEVLADLVRNTEISYKQNKDNPYLAVATPQEYFNEQLRRLNMDQSSAIRAWRQVMLFRRYFQDVGNSTLVDTLAPAKFNDYAKEAVTIDLYRLPNELKLADYNTLQNFEVYLNAVTKRSKDDLLALPTTFLTVSDVNKSYPELVEKRFVIEFSRVDKKTLQNRVPLKEMWSWEIEDKNWAQLKKQFPELAVKKDASKEERFAALENLDSATRARVDAVAKAAIVDQHPEWLEKALNEAQTKKELIGLRLEGGKAPLEGIDSKEKRQELIRLLDQAPVGEQPSPSSRLNAFSPDQQNYYRIKVIERNEHSDILTFAEANKDGTLNRLRDRLLEKYYVTIRDQNPALYQNADQSWKNISAVKNQVAEQYDDKVLNLDKLVKAITTQKQKASGSKETLTKDQAAALRFYAYLDNVKAKLQKDPTLATSLVKNKQEISKAISLEAKPSLANQWQIDKTSYKVRKGLQDNGIDPNEAFSLNINNWSATKNLSSGDLLFYQVKERGREPGTEVAIAEQTKKAQAALSADAQRVLMSHLLKRIKEKNAISLNYLNAPVENQTTTGESSTIEES